MASCSNRACGAARRLLVKLAHAEETLDERMLKMERSMHRAADSSMLFCSRPMQAALTRRSFQVLLLLLSVVYSRMLVGWVRRLGRGGGTSYRVFSLSVLEARNGSLAPVRAHVTSFGMLRDEQDVEKALEEGARVVERARREEDGAVVIRYDRRVEVNGFYFVTAEAEEELDPVRFVVYGEEEDGRRTVVGASGWNLDWLRADASPSPPYVFDGRKEHKTTRRRRAVEAIDLRPPLAWIVLLVILNISRTISFLVPLLLSVGGREDQGKLVLQSCTFVNGICVVGLMYLDGHHLVPKCFNLFFVWGIFILFFFDREQTFWTGFLVLFAIWGLAGMLLRSSFISMLGMCGCSFAVVVLLRRRNLVLESSLLCKKHMREQTKRWQEMMREEGWREDLARLEQLTNRMASSRRGRRRGKGEPEGAGAGAAAAGGGAGGRVYQRDDKERSDQDRFLLSSSVPADAVCSLARLYAQAELVRSILADKVRRWSKRAGASVDQGSTRRRSSNWRRRRALESWWGPQGAEEEELVGLKEEGRAMEKAVRCYGGDASRLLDVCRARVAVQDLRGAIGFLEAMEEDEEVVAVEGIKNRMAGRGGEANGRKDVIVYVRLETEEARRMGVSGHVCEVQVTLQELLLMEGEEERKQYRKYRLLR